MNNSLNDFFISKIANLTRMKYASNLHLYEHFSIYNQKSYPPLVISRLSQKNELQFLGWFL